MAPLLLPLLIVPLPPCPRAALLLPPLPLLPLLLSTHVPTHPMLLLQPCHLCPHWCPCPCLHGQWPTTHGPNGNWGSMWGVLVQGASPMASKTGQRGQKKVGFSSFFGAILTQCHCTVGQPIWYSESPLALWSDAVPTMPSIKTSCIV